MQFADLAFGESEKTNIGVPQSLVDGSYVFLIATNTI
jgi:hypothetical protein